MNGVSGPDGEDYSPWADRKAAQPKASSPPQSQSKLSDSYSNTLPVRKSVTPKNSYAASKGLDVSLVVPRPRGGGEGLQNPGHVCSCAAPLGPLGDTVLDPWASPGPPRCLWQAAGRDRDRWGRARTPSAQPVMTACG